MSDTKKILNVIADALAVYPQEIMIVKLRTVAAMLDRISTYQQEDAVLDAFGVKEDENA